MKKRSQSGQTAVEYIMLIAVVVGVSFALKTPVSSFLAKFFGSFSGRAVTATTAPASTTYAGGKGCSAPGTGGAGCD